ncbi:hypothetical protein AB6A40_010202 [Gnathostoma spinigerum]|uniref:Uncharacterized protein n=1 Tax=Gnathostoma spinigerum TaxID=75299 RepID=A0ABD6EUK1_9BILA
MEELETIDDRPCSSNGLPHGVLRVEIDTGHELYVRLFVPDPEKREIELSFRGDVASSLLRSFSLGEIPTFLIDLLEMSKVCLFYQGCVALQWDGAVRFLRPSMKTMYSDVRMIRNSVAPQLRRAAENSYWQNIAPPAKKIAFWSPGEQETRSFLLSYSWTRLRQMERNNAMELDRLEAITAAAARAESRGDIRFLSSSARLKLRETSRMGSKQNSLCNMVSTSTAAHPSRSEAPRWVEEATVNCVLDVANMNGTDSLHSHNICSLSNPSAQNDSPLSIGSYLFSVFLFIPFERDVITT